MRISDWSSDVCSSDLATAEGISVEVVDLRTIAPWDRETVLASARKTGRVIVVHEAVKEHGAGAEIAAVINEELFGGLKKPVKRLGGQCRAVPYSRPPENAYAPAADRMLHATKHLAS